MLGTNVARRTTIHSCSATFPWLCTRKTKRTISAEKRAVATARLASHQKRSERLHVLSLPEPDGWERPRAMVILGTKTGVGLYGSEFDGTLRQTEGPSIKCVRVCVCV